MQLCPPLSILAFLPKLEVVTAAFPVKHYPCSEHCCLCGSCLLFGGLAACQEPPVECYS